MTTDELKALRNTFDFTQAEMATRMGIKLRAYGEMENGSEDVPERYRLVAERVALSIAVERGNPFFAPASVRKEALALARLITEG